MNGSRTASIPFGHVLAELAAFPLASEAGLSLGLVALHSEVSGDSETLWRAAERALASASPSISLDELVAIRDDLWFHDHASTANGELPLSLYLKGLANRFLSAHGAVGVPHLGGHSIGVRSRASECDARNLWRWLSLALPPDLLLAALSGSGQPLQAIEVVSPLLGRHLEDEGFAETHLHLKAGFDFPRIWVSTMRCLTDTKASPNRFKSPGSDLQEGAHWISWLLYAGITRYVLAAFMRSSAIHDGLRPYIENEVLERFKRIGDKRSWTVLCQVLGTLYRGSLTEKLTQAELQQLYAKLIGPTAGVSPQEPDAVWIEDPISSLVDGTPPELHLISQSLRYLERSPMDRSFAGLFWQVVRVRCLFYRHLVQRPMTPGLQWFIRFFNRLKPARQIFHSQLQGRMAALLCGQGRGLQSLEVRTGPEPDFSKLYREVRDLDTALRPPREYGNQRCSSSMQPVDRVEFGLVFHFNRDRGGGWFEGRPTAHWSGSYGDPGFELKGKNNSTGYRYGSFYRKKRKEASAVVRLLSVLPLSLEIVRGLDVCTDEAGIPTWVLAPLLRYVRDAGKAAAALLGNSVPPLRTTVHAGEDFVHLMSGLRRLDETVDYLGLQEGDRLGHALSLGVDPVTWAERAGKIALSKEERLFDLVWEWSWYSQEGRGVAGGRQALIQREVAELSRSIFGRDKAPWQIERLVRNLHDERVLRYLGFPDGRPPEELLNKDKEEDKDEDKLACVYLTNPEIFKRGREIIWVDPALDIEALQHLQAGLRRKIGRMGLTVEVNPSSNLLIAHLGELGRHPLWRLAPIGGEDGIPPLSVCIGSDDPLTFATTLREEYQLLYDALIQNGHSEAVAHEWIDRARKAGLSARFTLPQSREPRDRDYLRSHSNSSGLSITLPP